MIYDTEVKLHKKTVVGTTKSLLYIYMVFEVHVVLVMFEKPQFN